MAFFFKGLTNCSGVCTISSIIGLFIMFSNYGKYITLGKIFENSQRLISAKNTSFFCLLSFLFFFVLHKLLLFSRPLLLIYISGVVYRIIPKANTQFLFLFLYISLNPLLILSRISVCSVGCELIHTIRFSVPCTCSHCVTALVWILVIFSALEAVYVLFL